MADNNKHIVNMRIALSRENWKKLEMMAWDKGRSLSEHIENVLNHLVASDSEDDNK